MNNQFQQSVTALGGLGRFGDTYMVHASEGETIIPMEILNRSPILKNRLFKTMRDMGINPERYIVGNKFNSINPITGQPEFFLKKVFDKVKKVNRFLSNEARNQIWEFIISGEFKSCMCDNCGSGFDKKEMVNLEEDNKLLLIKCNSLCKCCYELYND